MQAPGMLINPFAHRHVVLDHRFLIIPESPLNPAHHLPGGTNQLAAARLNLKHLPSMIPHKSHRPLDLLQPGTL